MPEQLFALIYEYVPDMLERRAPYRAAHLALLRELYAAGTLVMAGATGDPIDGGLIVFRGADGRAAHDFAAADPYGAAGLVTAARVVPWAVAVP